MKIKKIMHGFLASLAVALCFSGLTLTRVHADDNDVNAKAAITMDAQTGQILYQKNANQLLPVASCTKILTLAVIEQDIAKGKLSWNQKIKIDKHVAKVAHDWHFSNVELIEGHSYTVKSLVDSMMIVSADGSAEALAIADAGSTQAFNKKMQAVAHKAGVHDAKIYNMIGLSNGELGSYGVKGVGKKTENGFSAKDMALISRYLVNKYPDSLNVTKQLTADFKISDKQNVKMHNINGMLPNNGEAPKHGTMDGLKTGSTDKAGNCFVGTGIFDNRRLITVVLNVPGDFSQQFKETNKMIDIVQGAYQPINVPSLTRMRGGTKTMRVAKSKVNHVNVKFANGVTIWAPQNTNLTTINGKLTVQKDKQTISKKKIKAPIKKGEVVANYMFTPIKGQPSVKLPVIATQNVKRNSMF